MRECVEHSINASIRFRTTLTHKCRIVNKFINWSNSTRPIVSIRFNIGCVSDMRAQIVGVYLMKIDFIEIRECCSVLYESGAVLMLRTNCSSTSARAPIYSEHQFFFFHLFHICKWGRLRSLFVVPAPNNSQSNRHLHGNELIKSMRMCWQQVEQTTLHTNGHVMNLLTALNIFQSQ